jgi:hypothetical protein
MLLGNDLKDSHTTSDESISLTLSLTLANAVVEIAPTLLLGVRGHLGPEGTIRIRWPHQAMLE